jgi:hypothetical protein
VCASQTCLCTLCGRRVFHVQAYAGCSRVRVSQVRCVGFCGDVAAKQHHTSVVSASCDHTIKAWSDIAGMWMCTRTFKVGARPANVCVRATEESGSDCCFLLNTSMGGGGEAQVSDETTGCLDHQTLPITYTPRFLTGMGNSSWLCLAGPHRLCAVCQSEPGPDCNGVLWAGRHGKAVGLEHWAVFCHPHHPC